MWALNGLSTRARVLVAMRRRGGSLESWALGERLAADVPQELCNGQQPTALTDSLTHRLPC
eukprot:13092174-Alexandrium_andersonii.AAC.1